MCEPRAEALYQSRLLGAEGAEAMEKTNKMPFFFKLTEIAYYDDVNKESSGALSGLSHTLSQKIHERRS